MNSTLDLTGKRFGALTVIARAGISKRRNATWLCKCDCGNTIEVNSSYLVRGATKSCGCYRRKTSRERAIAQFTKHGESDSRLYSILKDMKRRCYNENCESYPNYGGRGITIYEGWLGEDGFENFSTWAKANGYDEHLTIDRINNDGDYVPQNCRWATYTVQANNTRKNVYVSLCGRSLTLAEYARATGNKYSTVKSRYHRGKITRGKNSEKEKKNADIETETI
ncbi:MAG: hypothetical protein PHE79_05150 [Eubacteriales bacterium]|nr:hypothetical protein [Eubacteriales bacterium]